MATVITNLFSAIPFIGKDLVPFFILSPLYIIFISNIKNKSNNKIIKDDKIIENKIIENKSLKDKYSDDKLNLLFKFIGFIDGDGYIRVTKKNKIYKEKIIEYIYISLIIKSNDNDLDLLKHVHSELHLGKVYNITPKHGRNKLARLEINKTDLKNIFLPLLNKYNIQFLTIKRQKQFLLMKYIMDNNIIYYKDIINNNKLNNYINNNLIKYNFHNLYYFNNWLVGFTIAEGSFIKKNNQSKDMCFQLKQKYNFNLFNSIKTKLNLNKCLSINKGKYIQLSVSSKKDIEKIIIFFEENKLLGYKLIQYKKWLLDLQINNRYKNININQKK